MDVIILSKGPADPSKPTPTSRHDRVVRYTSPPPNPLTRGGSLLDNGWLPIPLLRLGIRQQLGLRLKEMASADCADAMSKKMDYVARLKERPIAIGTPIVYVTEGRYGQGE